MPAVELLNNDGRLHASEIGSLVTIADGHESIINGAIYEMTTKKSPGQYTIEMSNQTTKLIKKRPNNRGIIRRAVIRVMMLYNVTIMSFEMTERAYKMALTNASMGKYVIVPFGAGGFQEINEVTLDRFYYIRVSTSIASRGAGA